MGAINLSNEEDRLVWLRNLGNGEFTANWVMKHVWRRINK
jgi:hypothetical protein